MGDTMPPRDPNDDDDDDDEDEDDENQPDTRPSCANRTTTSS